MHVELTKKVRYVAYTYVLGKISVSVKNTGDREGSEVVQLYVTDLYASITPSVKRLRGFQKINLKPGEAKTVNFTLTPRDLAFVDLELKWRVEKGDFEVHIDKYTLPFTISESEVF